MVTSAVTSFQTFQHEFVAIAMATIGHYLISFVDDGARRCHDDEELVCEPQVAPALPSFPLLSADADAAISQDMLYSSFLSLSCQTNLESSVSFS